MDELRPASPITEQYALPNIGPNHTKTLGKDEFLAILIAQLQNQDPTAPIENVDMVSQMTQFATMESINAMAVTNMQSQAISLIGKGIVGVVRNHATGEAREIIGTVDGAGTEAGKPYVVVGEARIFVEDILQVFDKSIIAGNAESITAATGMVGKFIRANVGTAADPIYAEGRVDRWITQDGVVFLTVEGTDISLHQVIAVADTFGSLGARPAAPAIIPPAPPAEDSTYE
jgi:flagellar basal-body rod modification protein FlgD